MRIIPLLYECAMLSMTLEDFYGRTMPAHPENNYLYTLKKQIEKSNSIYKNKMLQEIKQLQTSQYCTALAYQEFYSLFPHLKTRYNYLSDEYLLDEENIQSKVVLELQGREFIFNYCVSADIEEPVECESLSDMVDIKSKWDVDYKFQLSSIKDGVLRANFYTDKKNKEIPLKYKGFMDQVEDIFEVDMELMSNFYRTNPAIQDYVVQRHVVPQILTRCNHDNLIKDATSESVKVFETIITQREVFKIEPDLKFRKVVL